MIKIEKIKEGLYRALERAEQTRKRTKSAEDRDFVMLIKKVLEAMSTQKSEKL